MGCRLQTFTDDQHMHRLFEKFVLEYYRRNHSYLDEIQSAEVKWNLSSESDRSMVQFLPSMYTDIFLRAGDTVLIIDTKYYGSIMRKHFDKYTVNSANLYQIYTYVKNQDVAHTGKVSGLLLYAKTDEVITPDCSFMMDGNRIGVKSLDLNKEFVLISAQLDAIVEDWLLNM